MRGKRGVGSGPVPSGERRAWLLLAAISTLASCDGGRTEKRVCSAEELQAALAEARDGDTIRICEGEIVGSFVVPGGVTVRGEGRIVPGSGYGLWDDPDPLHLSTRIVAPAGEVAFLPTPGTESPTVIEDLTVVAGRGGIVSEGPGRLWIERVSVGVPLGFAIHADGIDSLVVVDTELVGAVTEENSTSWPSGAEPEDAPVRGLDAKNVGDVSIERLEVRGFSEGAVTLSESVATWSEGTVCGNTRVGIALQGGSTTLSSIVICDILLSSGLLPAVGLAVFDGGNVQTNRVSIRGSRQNDAYGIFQMGSRSQHENLTVTDNAGPGVVLLGCEGTAEVPAFSLFGDESVISDNGGFGVLVFESNGVVLDGARIERTRDLPFLVGEFGVDSIGDGIHVLRCACPEKPVDCGIDLRSIRLANLHIADNARVGLLVDGQGGSAAGVEVEAIEVSGQGEQLGAIAQDATAPPTGWDTEVTRSGAVASNDENVTEELSTYAECR